MPRQPNLNPAEPEAAAKRRPASNARPAAGTEALTVQQITSKLNILDWDVLLIGDGSGSGWDGACGWANVLVDKLTREYMLFSGAMNAGSVNLAEMMPYLHAMTWFHANQGRHRLKTRGSVFKVHIITDSKVTMIHGTQACDPAQPLPKVQQALWCSMREFVRLGYHFTFHWQERSTTLMNLCCDLVASLARRSVLDTGKGQRPATERADLLEAEQALRRLLRGNQDPNLVPTLQASLKALQLLLFEERTYAEQLATAMNAVRLQDPATREDIDLQVLDGHG